MNDLSPNQPLPSALKAPYQGYTYAYPHKSAYRRFDPPKPLTDLWRDEPAQSRFLYAHIPFCEMRCGFCNLFTLANPEQTVETAYLDAFAREAAVVAETAGSSAAPAQIALGGGTPTYLSPKDLDRIFDLLAVHFRADPATSPCSVETSPKTATDERLQLLKARGVHRVSIGVQSFDPEQARAMGRPQRQVDVTSALDRIKSLSFPVMNLDLIYGAAEQTPDNFVASVARALDWAPEEIYLYPLYVRPRTGLDGRAEVWDEHRLALYRAGRDALRNAGYSQISMRHFRKPNTPSLATEYSCQSDGLIGLGPGARSYTRDVHYAMDFAVSRGAVQSVLQRYANKTDKDFGHADHGAILDETEQKRRYLLKSVLRSEGLETTEFEKRFGISPIAAFPELIELARAGLLQIGTQITPTEAGLERSDAIGPWLYSQAVARRMAAFETT